MRPLRRRPRHLSAGQVRRSAADPAIIVERHRLRHNRVMKPSAKLFLPSARATNVLLIVGFVSIGYALYLRYLAIEQSTVGLACTANLDTWLCFSRAIAIALFTHSVFGIAATNLLRPSLVLFAVA